MLKRASWALGLLIAVFSPIALFSTNPWWPRTAASTSSGGAVQGRHEAAGAIAGTLPDGIDPSATESSRASPADAPLLDLAEVLRFDRSPDWIVGQWPRVSSGLGQLQLQGYRVPLVTGTAQDDLAGALTYYFNPRQQVQRITFHGTTGNARKVVGLVTSRFGLARRLTNDPSVFLYEIPAGNGKARSFLWIRPAPVVKESDPHRRFEVAMLIERPGSG